MITGIGTDIVTIERIRKAIDRHGDHFVNKIFTPQEIEYSNTRARKFEHLAARFAAKEAALKALGTGVAYGATLIEVEVTNNDDGKPHVELSGAAKKLADERKVAHIHISLSHTEEYAIAQVIMEANAE